MVQIPLRRAHRLRAIILASPTKKLRPQSTERAPTAWQTNDEYKNAEASVEASASSAVANVSENRVLVIPTSSLPVNRPPSYHRFPGLSRIVAIASARRAARLASRTMINVLGGSAGLELNCRPPIPGLKGHDHVIAEMGTHYAGGVAGRGRI